MNREVYEVNNEYCSVIADNGEIRILSKEDDKNTKFEDLLEIEDRIEYYENEVKRYGKIINQISVPDEFIKGFLLSGGIALAVGFLIGLGAYLGATVTQVHESMFSLIGSSKVAFPAIAGLALTFVGTMPQTIQDTIAAYRRKKALKNNVDETNDTIARLTRKKTDIGRNIMLVKEVSSPILRNEVAYEVARLISNNERSARQVEIDNLEKLRNEMTKYLNENGIKEESSRQYSINKRYRDR